MRRAAGLSGSQPLPESIVAELIEAGISRSTVLAMEGWKAQEVLDLLRSSRRREGPGWGRGATPGTVDPLAGPRGGGRDMVGFSTQE